jgi:hypothetical protein
MHTTTETAITDPSGGEDACRVYRSPASTDIEGNTIPASICLDDRIDLSLEQAGNLGRALLRLVDELTPADPEYVAVLRVAAEARGVELSEVAAVAGVDLESLSAADARKMGMTLGQWEQRLS